VAKKPTATEPQATIADLRPDPENARRHTPRNIGTIVDALHAVGAARSIVIDEDGVILAGNGTVEAAAEAGITRLRVVDADGEEVIAVRRRGLTPEQKRRLALADNRSAELAEWDYAALQGQLKALEAEGANLLTLGWSQDELDPILNSVFQTGDGSGPLDEPEPEHDGAAEHDGAGGAKLTFSSGQWQVVARGLDAARALVPGNAKDSDVLCHLVTDWLRRQEGGE
jgi:ParB-like chromosome segregation protein Spo0J